MTLECAVKRCLILQGMAALSLFAWPIASLAQSSLTPARDLPADAKQVASSGVPLIVLVSLPGCPHCEIVRRSHLLPLLREGRAPLKPLVRQIEMNGRDVLRDFDGRMTTHGAFASRHKIRIAPVVLFFDAAGQLVAEPLVGAMIPDFYGAYFDAALTEATLKVRSGRAGRLSDLKNRSEM